MSYHLRTPREKTITVISVCARERESVCVCVCVYRLYGLHLRAEDPVTLPERSALSRVTPANKIIHFTNHN